MSIRHAGMRCTQTTQRPFAALQLLRPLHSLGFGERGR